MDRPRPRRLQSAEGWYIAVIVERFEYYDEDLTDPKRRCFAYENLVLIGASSPEEAYVLAIENGNALAGVECVDDQGRKGEWKFVGLGELLPVYDKIEDGAEIMSTSRDSISVEDANRLARCKSGLGVFKHNENDGSV